MQTQDISVPLTCSRYFMAQTQHGRSVWTKVVLSLQRNSEQRTELIQVNLELRLKTGSCRADQKPSPVTRNYADTRVL